MTTQLESALLVHNMIAVRYVGTDPSYINCTALCMKGDQKGIVKVQFDECPAEPDLRFNWHGWPVSDWEIRYLPGEFD